MAHIQDLRSQGDAVAKMMWDSSQRMAVHIAAQPREQRDEAFAFAERAIREPAEELSITARQRDFFLKNQMILIKQFVAQIDAGGSPQGGHA